MQAIIINTYGNSAIPRLYSNTSEWEGNVESFNPALFTNYSAVHPNTSMVKLIDAIKLFNGTHNGFPSYSINEDGYLVISFNITDKSLDNYHHFLDCYDKIPSSIADDKIVFTWR